MFRSSLPVAGFTRQHQLVHRTQLAGSAKEYCFGLMIDGRRSPGCETIGISRMTSIIESSPIKNKSESAVGHAAGQAVHKIARAVIAVFTSSLGVFITEGQGRDQANPPPHFSLAQHGERTPDRVTHCGCQTRPSSNSAEGDSRPRPRA